MEDNPQNLQDEGHSCLGEHKKSENRKSLWPKLKMSTMFTGLHTLVSEKHAVLRILDQDSKKSQSSVDDQARVFVEGNAMFYSVENIKKRRALKRHPDVIARITHLWELIHSDENFPSPTSITKQQFVSLMIRLNFLMLPPPLDLQNIMESVEEDWAKDSKGSENMSMEAFFESIFELVDVWTNSISLEEYLSLLDRIIDGVSYLDEHGLSERRVLKDLKEINFDAVFDAQAEKDSSDEIDGNLCYHDDQVVLEAQRAMWEYNRSFHRHADHLKRHSWQGYDVDNLKRHSWHGNVGCIDDPDRTSEFLGFPIEEVKMNDDCEKRVIMKPRRVMRIIAKIYDAKIIKDQKKEEHRIVTTENEDRFDTFVFLWHIEQIGTKKRALENLGRLLLSVKSLARFHPRVLVFSKMIGLPVETADGKEDIDKKFKPFATSEYLFPFLKHFLSLNPKTGQLERLEEWFGVDFTPKKVTRLEAIAAAESTLKYVPQTSPVVIKFRSELDHICVDEQGSEILGKNEALISKQESSEQAKTPVPPMRKNATVSMKQPSLKMFSNTSPTRSKTDSSMKTPSLQIPSSNCRKFGDTSQQSKAGEGDDNKGLSPISPCFLGSHRRVLRSSSKSSERSKRILSDSFLYDLTSEEFKVSPSESRTGEQPGDHSKSFQVRRGSKQQQQCEISPKVRRQLSKKQYVDVDKAVCLLLQVWDADYEWKQVVVVVSAIVMMKRCIRNNKKRKSMKAEDTRLPEIALKPDASSGCLLPESPSKLVERFIEARRLDDSIDLKTW